MIKCRQFCVTPCMHDLCCMWLDELKAESLMVCLGLGVRWEHDWLISHHPEICTLIAQIFPENMFVSFISMLSCGAVFVLYYDNSRFFLFANIKQLTVFWHTKATENILNKQTLEQQVNIKIKLWNMKHYLSDIIKEHKFWFMAECIRLLFNLIKLPVSFQKCMHKDFLK